MSVRGCVATLVLVLCAGELAAQAPRREEQFIYSILAFEGRDYAGTFAQRQADTIYLVADVDNFITVRNAFVYYWPIAADWRVDTSVLDVAFEGTLELAGRSGVPQMLHTTPYTYYNVRGEYEQNWKVATDSEARAVWQHALDLNAAYFAAAQEFRQQRAVYDQRLQELAATIIAMRREGRDFADLVAEMEALEAPAEPQRPGFYTVRPVPIQQGFILNLPVGEHDVRFVTEDGSIMEGSERRIVAFEKRRAEAIGWEVVPGDKWTRPAESTTPASVLYTDGSTDLYLRPFFQQEYNDLFYEKMRRNDAKGNPALMKWVRIQQVPGAGVEITRTGAQPQVVREQPFYVEQVPGAALGYQIVRFDPEGEHAGREPSLRAFHIPLAADQRVVQLRAHDRDGRVLPTSERQVRIVSSSPVGLIPLILAAVPLVVMIVVMVRRSLRVSRG